MKPEDLVRFVTESNRIEGIHREPTVSELVATHKLVMADKLTLSELCSFVRDVAKADLRRHHHMNVRVGLHTPPSGGPKILSDLEELLGKINRAELSPYQAHVAYEMLHPFMDGNGRSGRAVWAWQMWKAGSERWMEMGFLHLFYYQTLSAAR